MHLTIKDKLAMSFKTIREMLRDRKAINDEEFAYLESFSENELVAMNNRSVFHADVGKRIRILYFLNKFKMADFKPHLEKAMKFDLCILVVAEKLTTTNQKSILSARYLMAAAASGEETNDNDKYTDTSKVEKADNLHIFELSEILINITKHSLVPKHEIISDEAEISEIVKRYNLKSRHQLPLILKTDPVARYFAMKPGQLARITRDSMAAAEYISYRCCV
jgi:DNA-directed RNA polymerase subunit H (RpoH/RPB5)